MTFDVFGDFETRGYLRNVAGAKDLAIVKRLEHRSFRTHLGEVLNALASRKRLTYQDVLDTHRRLFADVYPWAGQDRKITAPGKLITRGSFVGFAHPDDIRLAAEYALRLGNDPRVMREKPGEVMGTLALAHPFLDGNGRTIMTVHTALAQKAGFSIDWKQSDKTVYLQVLTKELRDPRQRHLDDYLKPLMRKAVSQAKQVAMLTNLKGLGGDEVPSTDPSNDGLV